MVLLIDANILLDVLMNRQPYVDDSSKIWKLCETGKVEGVVSALTFANIVYVMRKELAPETIEMVLNKLALIFTITELSSSDLINSAKKHWKDYEDAVQCATAERLYADYIVTRNVKDFKDSDIKAVTPTDFLLMYE